MRFSAFTAFAAALLASVVSAAPNAFTAPIEGTIVTAGQSYTLRWSDITGSTVSIALRNGNTGDLNDGTIIARDIQNTGSFTWTVPADQPRLADATFAIRWGTGASDVNYSARFTLQSNVVATSSISVSSTSVVSTSTSGSVTSTITSTSLSTSVTSASTSTQSGSTTTNTRSTTSAPSSTRTSSSIGTNTATTSLPSAPSGGSSNLASPLAIILSIVAAMIFTN